MSNRYASGTSLIRTRKETTIDALESHIGEMDDDLYIEIKKLRHASISKLIKMIEERNRS